MEIEFSGHSLDQLKERPTVTKEMVLETINNPDKKLSSYKQRTLYQKHYAENILEVVTILDSGKIVVITEYFLEK